jgi:AGZA family xanthine/uracil permease-like MFS transporter
MEKLFKLKEHGTNIKTELIAGLTTFMAMAYILAVNPQILSATGMDQGALFTATAIAAAIATVCMAVFANYPIALASGMGLNAFFAFTIVLVKGYSWQVALTAILIEGAIFMLLAVFKFREAIVNAIPKNLKLAITAGIGLFIAVVGMNNTGLFVAEGGLLLEGNFTSPEVVLAFAGIIIIAILLKLNIKGAVLLGIVATWALGIIAQLIGWYVVDPAVGNFSLIPEAFASLPPSIAPIFLQFDFAGAWKLGLDFLLVVFAFLMVDMFDTVGTLVGVAKQANLLDEKGNLPKAGRALMADAVGTTAGACLGVSTVTSYIESAAGVGVGGRTGLTSLTTGVLFLLALFLSPLFLTIPAFATAPALIVVGVMMMRAVKDIEWTDYVIAIPAFLTIIFMPMTYSIANGILIGFLSYTLIKLFTGKAKDVSIIIYVVDVLFILKILFV